MLPAGAPSPGVFTASAWDGKSLYVWPLTRDYVAGRPGARYDVVTDSWHTVAAIPPGEAVGPQTTAVNGRVYVIGFSRASANVVHVAEYDRANDGWSSKGGFVPVAKDEQFGDVFVTPAGSKVLISAGMNRFNKKENAHDYEPWQLYTYSPGEGVQALTTLPYADDPLSAPVPAGDRVLLPNVDVSVPGGGSSSVSVNDVVDLNGHVTRTPTTLTYSAPTVGKSGDVPGSIVMNQYVWTGKAFLAVEGGHRPLQAWQPGDSRWQVLTGSAESAPGGDPVWAGDRLIVLPQGAGVQGSEFAP